MFTTYMKHQGDHRKPALAGHTGLKRRRAIDGEFRPNMTGNRLVTDARGTITINKRPVSYYNIAPQKTQTRAPLEDGQIPMLNTFDLAKEQQAVKDLYTKKYKEKLAQEQALSAFNDKDNVKGKLALEKLIRNRNLKNKVKVEALAHQDRNSSDDMKALNFMQQKLKANAFEQLRRQLENARQRQLFEPRAMPIKEEDEAKSNMLSFASPTFTKSRTTATRSPQLDKFSTLDLTPQAPISERTREQLYRAIIQKIPEEDRNIAGKNTFRYKGNIFSYGNNKDTRYADKKTLQQIAQQTGAGRHHKSMKGHGMWLDAILQNIF